MTKILSDERVYQNAKGRRDPGQQYILPVFDQGAN